MLLKFDNSYNTYVYVDDVRLEIDTVVRVHAGETRWSMAWGNRRGKRNGCGSLTW